jgi:hypothetical protein
MRGTATYYGTEREPCFTITMIGAILCTARPNKKKSSHYSVSCTEKKGMKKRSKTIENVKPVLPEGPGSKGS